MSFILSEGFDLANTIALLGWGQVGNPGTNGTFSFVAGRIAGSALAISQGNNSSLGAAQSTPNLPTAVIGLAWQPGSIAVSKRIAGLTESGTEQMALRMDASGRLQVTRNGTVLVTETSITMSASTYYYLELKVVFGSSTGSYAVRRNGTVVLGIPDVTATNTIATANTYCNGILLANAQGATNSPADVFDDLYLLTTAGVRLNDFQGDSRVIPLLPSAAGSTTNMAKVGAAATNWQSVNENPPNGDTTYVQSSVIGTTDTYKYSSLPSTTSSVLAVYARPAVRKDDAGSRTITTHVRSNGAEADALGSITPATTYALLGQVMEINPVTGAAWSVADLNAVEFGPKILT